MHDIRPLTGGGRDESIDVHGTPVFGLPADHETRCLHWHEATDVVAIRFRCCGRFHPCYECHEAVAGHAVEVWPVEERRERALLCGVCGTTFRIDEYLAVDACPGCGAGFNPGCRLHRHLYFA